MRMRLKMRMRMKMRDWMGMTERVFREEEVPDPAAPAEGEYAEYTEEQQYAVSHFSSNNKVANF